MFKITYCLELRTVCKITDCVENYTLGEKLLIVCQITHYVCQITHILQYSTGVPFALNMEKTKFLSL